MKVQSWQSQKAYAAKHGLSYSTLKSRVQNGRAALRDVFENCCDLTLDARGNIADYRAKTGIADKSVPDDFEQTFSDFFLAERTFLGRGAKFGEGSVEKAAATGGGCCR